MGQFLNRGGVIVKIENGKEHFVTDLRKRKDLNAGNMVKNLNIINELPRDKKRQKEFDKKYKPVYAGSFNLDDKRIPK